MLPLLERVTSIFPLALLSVHQEGTELLPTPCPVVDHHVAFVFYVFPLPWRGTTLPPPHRAVACVPSSAANPCQCEGSRIFQVDGEPFKSNADADDSCPLFVLSPGEKLPALPGSISTDNQWPINLHHRFLSRFNWFQLTMQNSLFLL